MMSRPARSRLSRAPQAWFGSVTDPVLPARYSATADVVTTAPGVPWPSRRARSASRYWAPPPGVSRSACSTESVPVTTARQAGTGDHRAGLEEGRGLAAEIGDEVYRSDPLVRVCGKAAHQVAQALAHAEFRHGESRRLALGGDRRGIRGRDQDPARRPSWPEIFQVRRIAQVVEHDQPGPGGLAKPADKVA